LIPASTRRKATILRTRRTEIARLLLSLPSAVQHGDTHRGNIAFGPSDSVVLVDWQVTGLGPLLKDLAYFAATSLEPQTRRDHESALVEQYLVSLALAGGPALTHRDAWRMYRALVFTAYEAAVVTAAFGSHLQSPENAAHGVRRAVAAVEELDSFDCLAHLLDQRWVVGSG
jgi:aminoglycoside phosphotransferase (APT) family kinase protein